MSNINHFLHILSVETKETQEYIRNGKVTADKIFNTIRSHRNDVDRVKVTGSIGKRTAVGGASDFDIVIFLNNKEPPFTTIVKEVRTLLEMKKEQLKITKVFYDCDMLICFEASGYQFDLSFAGNYKSWNTNQWEGTWQKINSLPNPAKDGRWYSPGLAEYAVDFLKQQDQFVHSVIRLAKYWNSNKVKTEKKIVGGSLMMELLAINACRKTNKNDLHLAFKQFLTNIVNFDQLRIYFDKYYSYEEIPYDVKYCTGSFILDPVNYYNNLGQNMSAIEQTLYKAAANSSLLQFQTWENNPHGTYESFCQSEIFQAKNADARCVIF